MADRVHGATVVANGNTYIGEAMLRNLWVRAASGEGPGMQGTRKPLIVRCWDVVA